MTDYMPKNTIYDIIRAIFATLDRVVYSLMTILYEIFFTVATSDILGGEMIRNIYYRVQLILGVFMVFKLAVSILQGIVNPDLAYDKKGKGMSTIIIRIIVSLIMLVLIAPINIPSPSNEWEQKVNNNGILFGTLFSLQNRVLSNNTIGRIITGTTDNATGSNSSSDLSKIGKTFSSTILKSFVRINVLPQIQENPGEGKAPETLKANRVCKDINNGILQEYNKIDVSPNQLLSFVNLGCGRAETGTTLGSLWKEEVQELLGKEYYAFSYVPLISTIAGVIIDFVLIAYSIDVAIRVFKIAILRIIAPIPIIGHMNISSKEGKGQDSFSLWTQSLISTYLELFIRLAIIYFVLFIVQNVLIHGFNFSFGGSSIIINIFAGVFITIGLMLFAYQAPNYIKSVLGVSGSGSIGMNAIVNMAGNLSGGSDLKKSWDATKASIAKENYGDKSSVAGGIIAKYKNVSKTAADKIADKNDKSLEREFYRRGLDIDDYSYRADDGSIVYGLDYSQKQPKWWQNKDAKDANRTKDVISRNTNRYAARLRNYDPADGRGVTARSGDGSPTSIYTAPTTYMHRVPNPTGAPGQTTLKGESGNNRPLPQGQTPPTNPPSGTP